MDNMSQGINFSYDGEAVRFFSFSGKKVGHGKTVTWEITQGRNEPKIYQPYPAVDYLTEIIHGVEYNNTNRKSIHAIIITDDLAVDLFLGGIIRPKHLQKARELALQSPAAFSKLTSTQMVVFEQIPIMDMGVFRIIVVPSKVLEGSKAICVDKDMQKIWHLTHKQY